jgi:hypothetical protein
MNIFWKPAVLSAAMLTGIAFGASADPGTTTLQIAALPQGGATSAVVKRLDVSVDPPERHPYASGTGPANRVGSPHFRVWAGYDADLALHPYTSNLGPCAQGAGGSCAIVIPPSRYERPPFTD